MEHIAHHRCVVCDDKDRRLAELQRERWLLRDALHDLVALYASTTGHDPTFVQKGKTALSRGEE